MIALRPSHYLIAAAVLAGVMLYGSLTPELAPPGEYGFDKVLHAGAYGTLTGLGVLGTRSRRGALIVMLAALAFGGGIEIAQSFIPERSGSWGDFAANATGAVLATITILGMRRRG